MGQIPKTLVNLLKAQKYHIIGNHSAIKRCRWFYNTLIHDKPCYKQKFYGIKTHQCIQMTPSVVHCTNRCLFCWRAQSGDKGVEWTETAMTACDDPEDIIKGCIEEQRKLLSGYKANLKVNKEKYEEAKNPRHAAISLTGEPTLYTRLNDLIDAFHDKKFTTFLVTNGTLPKSLSNLNKEPTQLYISVCAPDKNTYLETCRPQTTNSWRKLNETLELLPSFSCPTVIRITLARHLNLHSPQLYSKILEKAQPTYIEPKAYMHIGFSRLRLEYTNMPTHKEIKEFAVSLTKENGYNLLDESKESRIVLLSRMDKPIKLS